MYFPLNYYIVEYEVLHQASLEHPSCKCVNVLKGRIFPFERRKYQAYFSKFLTYFNKMGLEM